MDTYLPSPQRATFRRDAMEPFSRPRGIDIPDDWRDRLPDPTAYYGPRVAKLGKPNHSGYAVGLCPFHGDHNPSFGVKLTSGRGYWCCYSGCGKGDMVEFHQRLTGLGFRAAVLELLEVR